MAHWKPHRLDSVSDKNWQGTTEQCVSGRENNSTRTRVGNPADWAQPPWGSRRGTPRFRTASLTETLASNHTVLETRRRTGTRRLKRRGQGRRGRRSSRGDRPPHRQVAVAFLPRRPASAGSAFGNAPRKWRAAQQLQRVRAGRKGGRGMGRRTGRRAESSGTAGACDLPRFTARGKGKAGARALARQRSVTSPRRTGPHVGLFGSRQAPPPRPRPLCHDGDVRETRGDGRLALCFPAFRPALFLRRARTSELGHSLDLVCHLPPGLSPGPAAVGPQPRATSPASRWSHCFVSPHGAESLSVLGFGKAHRKTCSAGLAGPQRPNQPT